MQKLPCLRWVFSLKAIELLFQVNIRSLQLVVGELLRFGSRGWASPISKSLSGAQIAITENGDLKNSWAYVSNCNVFSTLKRGDSHTGLLPHQCRGKKWLKQHSSRESATNIDYMTHLINCNQAVLFSFALHHEENKNILIGNMQRLDPTSLISSC